jgi:hypothetical protein
MPKTMPDRCRLRPDAGPDNGHGDGRTHVELSEPLRVRNGEQIAQVDRALASRGPFGEVRLCFIERLDSQDLPAGRGLRERE